MKFLRFVVWPKETMKRLADKAITSGVGNYSFTFYGVRLFGVYIGIIDGRLKNIKRGDHE